MKVKWTEFNSYGYATARRVSSEEIKIENFTHHHEGEVIETYVANDEPMFLVREGNKFVTAKATECEVIED